MDFPLLQPAMPAKSTFLTVALSVMSAFSALAADIQITSLPSTIVAPGTYVLTTDVSYTGNSNALTINTPLPGPVVVDLAGHTLNGSNNAKYWRMCFAFEF
jgi:hypothetical protein